MQKKKKSELSESQRQIKRLNYQLGFHVTEMHLFTLKSSERSEGG